ncbi:MAG: DNA-primase RepB domain-containing protein [Gammaproteobacteria bacterium]|nr:DNA-primase RepB domain-containing protein [Gammaproteobacteria bacterium]
MSDRAVRPDTAARELDRLLNAVPAKLYEFAVFDGRMTRRTWRGRQAMQALGWLRRRNGAGAHVYFRPATTACVLVDDLDAEALAAVAADGLRAAAVVETSPGNHQAWFRVGRELGPKLGTCAGQVLAARYGGDPAWVDFRHLGRAAGFANRKAKHRDGNGDYPFVVVVEAKGRVTPRAEELVADAEARLQAKEAKRAATAARVARAGRARSIRHDPQAFLAREVGALVRRDGAATDMSRAEAAACRRMALAGFAQDEVAAALAACPDVRRRKAGHVEDYAARTAAWAFGGRVRRPR